MITVWVLTIFVNSHGLFGGSSSASSQLFFKTKAACMNEKKVYDNENIRFSNTDVWYTTSCSEALIRKDLSK